MASVWKEMKGKQPEKLAGMLPPQAAVAGTKLQAGAWLHTGANRRIKQAAALSILLIENEKLVGSLFVEPISPPSKPEPGQPHVAKQQS